MKRFASIVLAVITVFCFVLASEGRAWGYVDPGSGLLALQGFATAAAGVMYYMRRRIMAFFGRQRPSESAKPAGLKSTQERTGKAA